MKRILVTGASGTIGMYVIKYLLSEGKYEVTAVDLKTKKSVNNLKRYRRRINVIYGDVCDKVLMEALIKGHDIVIHLASCLPPFANYKKGLADLIDYEGTKNIVKAINYYHPECHLFYASSMMIYQDKNNVTVKSKLKSDKLDYYSMAKIKTEKLIREKLENYTIYRLPLILSDVRYDNFMYHGNKDDVMSFITKEDAGYAFVCGINHLKGLNHNTYNVTSGEELSYREILNNILKINGLSFKYLLNRIFVDKDYISPTCKDKDDLNKIIDYQNDTFNSYIIRLRGRSRKRKINQFLAKPFIRDVK